MKSFVFSLTMLLPLAMLCGCGASSSLPTEDAAKQALQDKITEQNKGRLKLVSFRKTDGQSGMAMGVQTYKMEVEGEVEVTTDCYWPSNSTEPRTHVVTNGVVDFTGSGGAGTITPEPKEIARKGTKRKIVSTVFFEKSEKGWKVVGG